MSPAGTSLTRRPTARVSGSECTCLSQPQRSGGAALQNCVVAGEFRRYYVTVCGSLDGGRQFVAMPGLQTAKSPNPADKHVGKRVRMRRMMLSMSQTNLGTALGLTFQQVQKYEKGTNRIGAGRLQQIAHVLRVPVSFFFEDPLKPNGGSIARQTQSPVYVADFLATTDGLALTKAFMGIKDPRVRRSVVKLVEEIVGESD
jgi:transcriptional regulator with XRE-family HTH domain